MTLKGELPSAATSTRMKNQNQRQPAQTMRPPIHQSVGTMPCDGPANTMIAVVTR
ncbi:hypothetical protein D3C83_271950 [compost metagenome]